MKKNSFLTRLFSHNIVLLILSFLLAFIAWFIINANSETEMTRTISGIPMSVTLPKTAMEKGYQIFTDTDFTASVEVSGKRAIVGTLTASDIQVTANWVSTIDHADEYNPTLSAKKVGRQSNYNIISDVNPSSIKVFVDKYAEKELLIDKQQMKVIIDTDYYPEITMSNDTVHLSGAASKIDEIETVAIIDTINVDSIEPITMQESLTFLDKNGDPIDLQYVTSDLKSVEVTVTPYPRKDVTLALNILNEPKEAPEVTLEPSQISIYGPAEQINSIVDDTVYIGTLDYRKLINIEHNIPYNFLPEEFKDCHVITEDTDGVIAKLDLSSYAKTVVTATIKTRVDTSKYTAEIASNATAKLTVFGPEDVLEDFSDSDVSVIADITKLTDQLDPKKTVSLSVPLTVVLGSGYSTCWVFETDPVTVNVTPK